MYVCSRCASGPFVLLCSCSLPCDATTTECMGATKAIRTRLQCLEAGGAWLNAPFNFDNIWQAMITMFQLSFAEGWQDTMFSGVDAVGPDLAPIQSL